MDFSHLALRLGHRRRDLCHALPSLPRGGLSARGREPYNREASAGRRRIAMKPRQRSIDAAASRRSPLARPLLAVGGSRLGARAVEHCLGLSRLQRGIGLGRWKRRRPGLRLLLEHPVHALDAVSDLRHLLHFDVHRRSPCRAAQAKRPPATTPSPRRQLSRSSGGSARRSGLGMTDRVPGRRRVARRVSSGVRRCATSASMCSRRSLALAASPSAAIARLILVFGPRIPILVESHPQAAHSGRTRPETDMQNTVSPHNRSRRRDRVGREQDDVDQRSSARRSGRN